MLLISTRNHKGNQHARAVQLECVLNNVIHIKIESVDGQQESSCMVFPKKRIPDLADLLLQSLDDERASLFSTPMLYG
ncbi:hypothetical protein HY285_04075 [Candidatus Peregrinibacteria bacterium]|nr:hypothetical protein [Candidatus Peregrinibacteria bacterium]MBI3816692.1 hypothetical protein [Candidatus Peregrinibacteria bacterium]